MTNNLNKTDQEIIEQILKDRKVMIEVTRKSIQYFFYIYFGSYIQYKMAPFHLDMFGIAQDDNLKRAGIVAFRGSAKSTLLNTAYALWAVMGIHKKKHIVIASQTQQRAKDHLKNVRKEIEKNQLLRQNLGPFQETEDQWHATSLVIPRYEARITAVSVEEGIRGLREGPHRPDLIIVDDIEDSAQVKTKENRDKTFNWLTGELLPMGDINTKAVFIGNFLHEDSALTRIEKMILEGKMIGKFIRVPLIDENENITWPGMFPSMEAVEKFRQSIGNEVSWQREYLLRIIPDSDQVIYPEWIHRYTDMPVNNHLLYTATGIDLAISQKDTADYTAMVSARIYRIDGTLKIYILPNPINERITFPQTVERIKHLKDSVSNGHSIKIFVEKVGYQEALVQQLQKDGVHAEAVSVMGQDKRARVALTTAKIQNGDILFPEKGAEILIQQLLGFGSEKFDDLVDAFSLLVLEIIRQDPGRPDIIWI